MRVKKEPHYKGSNPKIERIKRILKYSKALEKLILSYENDLIDYDDAQNIEKVLITNDNNKPNDDALCDKPKRRGRPRAKNIQSTKDINKDKEINNIINNFDEKVKIDYTGINELMNNKENNNEIEIET